MKYRYTLYKADGTTEEIGEFKRELSFKDTKKQKGLYSWLECRTIELLPRDYYPEADGKNSNVTFFGDEEGRFTQAPIQNRHMKVMIDSRGNIWDVVGNVVREEKISERASKSK